MTTNEHAQYELDDAPDMAEASGGYELPSIDVHDSVIAELIYDGERPNPYKQNKPRKQGICVFQLDERNEQPGTFFGKRKEIRFYFTWSWGTKKKPSKIRELLENWRGKPFTEEELKEYGKPASLAKLLVNKSCRVNVIHKPGSDNNMRARVAGIVKAKNPMQVEDYTRIRDRKKKDDSSSSGPTFTNNNNQPTGFTDGADPDEDDIPF